MRTLLVILFLLLFLTIFSVPAWLILWIIRQFSPETADRGASAIVKGAFRIVSFLSGVRLQVIGQEHIPKDTPVLYVSNHRSYFDIVIGHPLTAGMCGFVAKKETLKVPSLRVWMKLIHCQFLDRENMREGMKTIKACVEQIRDQHISLWICPEGTRNHEAEMLPFREGSFKIAEMAGCPIIPVALQHTDDIYENHSPWIHRQTVTVTFGEPIETAALDRAGKKALPKQVQEQIKEMGA